MSFSRLRNLKKTAANKGEIPPIVGMTFEK